MLRKEKGNKFRKQLVVLMYDDDCVWVWLGVRTSCGGRSEEEREQEDSHTDGEQEDSHTDREQETSHTY